MSFGVLEQGQKRITKHPNKKDERRARKLIRLLQKKGRTRGQKPKVGKWSEFFRKLRQVDSVSGSRIDVVLQWLADHIDYQYVPRIKSAKDFRLRFSAVEDAMTREDMRPSNLSDVKITEESRLIEDWNGGLVWPDDKELPDEKRPLKQQELAVTQKSLDNYRHYKRLLARVYRDFKGWTNNENERSGRTLVIANWQTLNPETLAEFLIQLDGTCIEQLQYDGFEDHIVRDFVSLWMLEVHRTAWEWDGWKGSLAPYVFHYESKRFAWYLEDAILEFCCDMQRWDDMKRMLRDYERDETAKWLEMRDKTAGMLL